MIAPPPRAGDTAGKTFYAEPDRVAARVVELKEMGFDGVAVNATAIFQSGSRSVDAMLDALRAIHDRLRQEVG
jgi:alkanesulfonate monooxygenase SsuD/methylene tetrahydromethanopterin reductase-like flavin-dependent oxidoreductase (luciferase family)